MEISHKYYVIFTLYTQLCRLNEAQGERKTGGRGTVEEKGKIDRKVEKDKSAITNKNVVIKVKLERKVRNMCVWKEK